MLQILEKILCNTRCHEVIRKLQTIMYWLLMFSTYYLIIVIAISKRTINSEICIKYLYVLSIISAL